MKNTSLESLLIDQSLGELPGEVSDLLEAYLESSPRARADAAQVRAALGVTERAVLAHPSLLHRRDAGSAGRWRIVSLARFREAARRPLPRAAAVAALALAAGLAGHMLGSGGAGERVAAPSGHGAPAAPVAPAATPETREAPWASYRIEESGFEARLSLLGAPGAPESRQPGANLPRL